MNPEYKKLLCEKTKKWQHKNPDKMAIRYKKDWQKNKKIKSLRLVKWRENNREHYNSYMRSYRLRQVNLNR